jgi:16S rRNA (adenine1518-N6/adenine1519-N6)-dimethyltransferase
MERVFDVPPEAFFPPPKVDSSIVRMVPWATLPAPATDYNHLQKLVAQSFGQRRKTLRNNVKSLVSDAELEALGISPSCRPENVTLEQYVALSNYLVAAGR